MDLCGIRNLNGHRVSEEILYLVSNTDIFQ